MNIIEKSSPNFNRGRKGYKPEAVVIHIMEGTLSGTDSWFANPQSKVSAHYGVGQSGAIHRYVREADTAWHAGRVSTPTWPLIRKLDAAVYLNPNYYTIGIEHEGHVNSDWSDAMYKSSSELIRDITTRWQIPLDREHVIGHHEIYGIKTCPGYKVDMNRLIILARAPVVQDLAPALLSKVTLNGTVKTKARLNLRRSPDRVLPPLSMVNANVSLDFDGYTDEGEEISGNSTWYFNNQGQWFWSGAVL
ncbi:MAG TPA: peptidoglycan recognition family protein [Ohtaekwangia sp.]|nr:peptidoglycan recognition family protein [Ohtaekwangia sp.]